MSMITNVQREIKAQAQAGAAPLSTSARKVLRNTYLLLAISMIPTIAGAFAGVTFIAPLLALGPIGFFIGFMVFAVGMQVLISKNRNSMVGVYCLLLFTFGMGYFLGPLLSVALTLGNGPQLIATAFGGTAAIFFILAGYASTTSKNLSTPSIGKTLFIGMLVILAIMVLNLFLQIPALSLALSAVIILLFSGFIIYDINRVVRGGEDNYIVVTMSVYLSLFNIFVHMLHLLMAFAGNRD